MSGRARRKAASRETKSAYPPRVGGNGRKNDTEQRHLGLAVVLRGGGKAEDECLQQIKAAVLNKTLGEVVRLSQPGLMAEVEEDAYRNQVLRAYFKRGRLVQIPAQLKKRLIILEKLAKEFEPEREYPERQVNLILLEFHDDVASLRRALISNGFMEREKGIYRRGSAADR